MSAENDSFSRRNFFATTGAAALGLAVGRLPGTAYAAEALPPLPWGPTYYPAAGLNAAAVREAGYCLYYREGGCGHASAQALIDALGSTLASENPAINPWVMLPRGLFKYAGAGVVGWGTICGTLNASLAVMDMLGVHNQLGNALMDYFCNTELPTQALASYVPPSGVPAPLPTITRTVSHSPICHNSMSIWAEAAGVPVTHPSAKDRDAKLVGDMVFTAVELLNGYFRQGITPAAWTPPANYGNCYSCHTQPDMVPSEQGRMDCTTCHDMVPAHGSWRRRSGTHMGGR